MELQAGTGARESIKRENARRNGFEAAFREFYPAVLAFAQRRTDTPQQAEDAAADSFAIAWRRWDARPHHLLPWLYGIARRVLANSYRSAARRQALAGRIAVENGAASQPDHTEGTLEREAIREAFAQLSESDRELLMLTEWEGLSASEAARVLGCRTASLHVRMHRARKRLLGHLNGGTDE